MPYQQKYADAQKKQLLSEMLAGQAMTPRERPQGRIVANTGPADGLSTLAMALASRRAGKQATALGNQADEERRKAQAAALSGMGNPPNLVETQAAQNPYARAQGALEADVDPNVVGAYLKNRSGGGGESPFGVIDPSDFTPQSLAKFQQSRNYNDLEPVNRMFGRYNPRDYTPESWAQFQDTGDPAVLQRFAERKFQETPGGGIIPLDPISGGQAGPAVLTAQQGTQEAAERKGAEATASAQGAANVIPADRRLDAQAKEPRLAAAERRLERVAVASEMLGSGGGPVEGRLRSWVGTPAAQELEAANAQLINELTALTRIPGVGSQSDLEQRLAQLALPNASQHPEVRARSIKELRTFIADLDDAIRRVGGGGTDTGKPAAEQANPSGSVNWSELQ